MQPCTLGGGANEHSRSTNSPISDGKQRGPAHRLHTEPYKYDAMSNEVPPAGKYLRAPVCCSECEQFWKALILEVDEKHTSRAPAGKASLIMAKGANGSVLQIHSTKHVTKERRFRPGISCKNVAVRGDAFLGSRLHSCQSAARQISSNTTSIKNGYRSPPKKLNIKKMRSNHVAPAYSTPSHAESSLSRRSELQGRLHSRYNAHGATPKYDVISNPRRRSHGYGHIPGTDRPKSAVHPEPPGSSPSFTQTRSHNTSSEANQAHRRQAHPEEISGGHSFKPVRTRIDRAAEGFSHLSTPRRYTPLYSESFPISQGLQHPSSADSSQLKPFSPPTSFSEKANSPRELFSHPTTPRIYSPMPRTPGASALQEKHVEEFWRYSYPPTTPQTPGSWDTHNYRVSNSAGGNASPTLRQSNNSYGVQRASPKHPPEQEDYLNSTPSGHRNANPNPGDQDIPSERKLSRTSTIESGYTTLSIPRSDCSASSSNSQELDIDSPTSSPRSRARGFDTKTLRPQDLPRNADNDPRLDTGRPSRGVNLKIPQHGPALHNLSRTSSGTSSSLMEPIVLFTGHGCCRSETDENSEDDDDILVTNPNYFKHIITNPNYMKYIVKPQAPQPPRPPPSQGLKTS